MISSICFFLYFKLFIHPFIHSFIYLSFSINWVNRSCIRFYLSVSQLFCLTPYSSESETYKKYLILKLNYFLVFVVLFCICLCFILKGVDESSTLKKNTYLAIRQTSIGNFTLRNIRAVDEVTSAQHISSTTGRENKSKLRIVEEKKVNVKRRPRTVLVKRFGKVERISTKPLTLQCTIKVIMSLELKRNKRN